MTSQSPLDVISPADARAIGKTVLGRLTTAVSTVEALVDIRSLAIASAQFASNEILSVGGRTSLLVTLRVDIDGQRATVISDRHDPEGLAALVADGERLARQNHGKPSGIPLKEPKPFTDPPLYHEVTRNAGAPGLQGDLLRRAAETMEKAELVGAGSMMARTESFTVMSTAGVNGYTRKTYGELSVSARTKSGKGSGWAWGGGEDWSKIDPTALAARAIDIAKRSDNPVAVEPGRYTVILEPEALSQIVEAPILQAGTSLLSAGAADGGRTVFSRFEGKKAVGNKLGLQVADRRVQLFYDPSDSDIPFSPLAPDGGIMSRTSWIENGVLKNLAYSEEYARQMKREELTNPQLGKLEISGPQQSLEEMIAGTARGIWVHRFSEPTILSPLTLLMSGVTRDGTFLIENGKITKSIKNLRFSESPFFILNKIEAFGRPVRASDGLACPRLKVRDFEFTSLSDAI